MLLSPPPDFEPPSQAGITSKKDSAEKIFPMSQGTTLSKCRKTGFPVTARRPQRLVLRQHPDLQSDQRQLPIGTGLLGAQRRQLTQRACERAGDSALAIDQDEAG